MNKVITIGREFGSGGRELGRRLAEKLKIAYYDQEIIMEIVKRTALTEEYVRSIEENQPLPLLPITTGRTFSLQLGAIVEQHQSVFLEQSKILRELAEKSDCVIVGRCADYVLRESSPFRLFVYADMKSKMERCRIKGQFQKDLNDRDLQRQILSVDKTRAKYYQFYTGQTWGEKKHYDLCINTASTGVKSAVLAIEKFVSC